jgi:hypothetical protein
VGEGVDVELTMSPQRPDQLRKGRRESRFPGGTSYVAQHTRNASITSGPYLRIGVRGRCRSDPAAASRNALRA